MEETPEKRAEEKSKEEEILLDLVTDALEEATNLLRILAAAFLERIAKERRVNGP